MGVQILLSGIVNNMISFVAWATIDMPEIIGRALLDGVGGYKIMILIRLEVIAGALLDYSPVSTFAPFESPDLRIVVLSG